MKKWPDIAGEAGTATCIVVTATWLKPDFNTAGLHPPGDLAYRCDRTDGRIGGGSLRLVAEHVTQAAITILGTKNIQSTGYLLKQPHSAVAVVCTYCSPWSSTEEDDQFMAHLRQVAGQANRVLRLGDLNAPEVDWLTENPPPAAS
ncbi:unnamed protein product [Echinostoma caproni]|uniref:Endo/exonuclease/phosphatase domain-containing protein n=1 Tax=Echinostoma caproni TaxID=27848 RepID=A0A183BBE2_9TREM|nr:unnamed protein product [Echinostoma caproni]